MRFWENGHCYLITGNLSLFLINCLFAVELVEFERVVIIINVTAKREDPSLQVEFCNKNRRLNIL